MSTSEKHLPELQILAAHLSRATGKDASRGQAHLLLPDESATQAFAQTLATQPAIGQAFITLRGDLGAGKTTLVRHLLRALGVQGRIKSPSYAVVETYELPAFQVWHLDFFRFTTPQEWVDAGLRDIFASQGLKLVEWPEKAGPSLPPADLAIGLQVLPDGIRALTLHAHTDIGAALLPV